MIINPIMTRIQTIGICPSIGNWERLSPYLELDSFTPIPSWGS